MTTKEAPEFVQHTGHLPQHVDPTVDAGIHSPAVTVGGILDHPQVIHPLDHDPDRDAEFIGDPPGLIPAAGFPGRAVAERAGEMDRRQLDPLLDHHLDGQRTVQAPRKQDHRTSFHPSSPISAKPQHRRFGCGPF